MKTFKATRSFYGDLGNIRRDQLIEVDEREHRKTIDTLLSRGLIVEQAGKQPARTPRKPTAKA
jgi:hypothetical protein